MKRITFFLATIVTLAFCSCRSTEDARSFEYWTAVDSAHNSYIQVPVLKNTAPMRGDTIANGYTSGKKYTLVNKLDK